MVRCRKTNLASSMVLLLVGAIAQACFAADKPVEVQARFTMPCPTDVQCISFGAGSKRVYIARSIPNGGMKSWDTDSGKDNAPSAVSPDEAGVFALSLSPDDKFIAAAGRFDSIELLDAQTAMEAKRIRPSIAKGITFTSVAWSHDAARLAWSGDKQIEVWDVALNRSLTAIDIDLPVSTLDYSPDGKLLLGATTGDVGHLDTWDVATGKHLRKIDTKRIDPAWGLFIDNRTVIGHYGFFDVATFDAVTGAKKGSFPTPTVAMCAALSPNHRLLAVSGADRTGIELRDMVTGHILAIFKGKNQGLDELVYSSDGKLLASIAKFDGLGCLWDVPPKFVELGTAKK
jgi:WD40 repeat protein